MRCHRRVQAGQCLRRCDRGIGDDRSIAHARDAGLDGPCAIRFVIDGADPSRWTSARRDAWFRACTWARDPVVFIVQFGRTMQVARRIAVLGATHPRYRGSTDDRWPGRHWAWPRSARLNARSAPSDRIHPGWPSREKLRPSRDVAAALRRSCYHPPPPAFRLRRTNSSGVSGSSRAPSCYVSSSLRRFLRSTKPNLDRADPQASGHSPRRRWHRHRRRWWRPGGLWASSGALTGRPTGHA